MSLLSLAAPNLSFACAVADPCNGVSGHRHINHTTTGDVEGGFVADTAHVDDSVWIADTAHVCARAQVLEFAKIFGCSVVDDDAVVKGNAILNDNAVAQDHSVVEGFSVLHGNGFVQDHGHLYGGDVNHFPQLFNFAKVGGNARVTDGAWIQGHVTVMDNAVIFGRPILKGYSRVDGAGKVADTRPLIANMHNTLLDGHAHVGGNSFVSQGASIMDYGTTDENANVWGDFTSVGCNATVKGNAKVTNKSFVTGRAVVSGNSKLSGDTVTK